MESYGLSQEEIDWCMNKNILLIGFMGTGKTTIGQRLAEILGWTFTDTDKRIEELTGMSIPELFAEKGEAYFRQVESEVIESLRSSEQLVVSTGGGAVLREANREAMLASGLVVALTADAETIISRVRGDANRPLLAGDLEGKVRQLLRDRAGAYDFAHVVIDTSNKAVEEIVQVILAHAT
jgi:shikimate kinase